MCFHIYSLKTFHALIRIKSIYRVEHQIKINQNLYQCQFQEWRMFSVHLKTIETKSKKFLGVMATKAKKCHVL